MSVNLAPVAYLACSGITFSTNPINNETRLVYSTAIMGNLLYTIAVVLIIIWLLGFLGFNSFGLGGLIHVLLVIAVIAIVLRLIQGRGV